MFRPQCNPLRRYYGPGDLHFITTSCYRRKPFLGTDHARDMFLKVLEQVRRLYRFDVIGFVVMPEHTGVPNKRRCCGGWGGHVHLMLREPERANPSAVMQVLKKNVSDRLLGKKKKYNPSQSELWKRPFGLRRFWQRRFYDFNVFSEAKIVEKLRYMHRNPVKRGLVSAPELWRWSSYRVYAFGERGPVNMDWMFPPYVMKRTKVRRFGEAQENDLAIIQPTHPANRTQGAAPSITNKNQTMNGKIACATQPAIIAGS